MATSAHTEAPSGGHKAAFPPFERESFASQLVWFAICFIVLYLLMSRLALPRIGGILAERRGRIEEDLRAAQGLKEQSDA
jgi:F-type H+-transporting ATPase subunit b